MAVSDPTYTTNGVTEVGTTSLSHRLQRPQPWIGFGIHLLLGEQRELLKNPLYQLCFEPGTLGTSSERSNHSVTVPPQGHTDGELFMYTER